MSGSHIRASLRQFSQKVTRSFSNPLGKKGKPRPPADPATVKDKDNANLTKERSITKATDPVRKSRSNSIREWIPKFPSSQGLKRSVSSLSTNLKTNKKPGHQDPDVLFGQLMQKHEKKSSLPETPESRPRAQAFPPPPVKPPSKEKVALLAQQREAEAEAYFDESPQATSHDNEPTPEVEDGTYTLEVDRAQPGKWLFEKQQQERLERQKAKAEAQKPVQNSEPLSAEELAQIQEIPDNITEFLKNSNDKMKAAEEEMASMTQQLEQDKSGLMRRWEEKETHLESIQKVLQKPGFPEESRATFQKILEKTGKEILELKEKLKSS